MQSMYGISPSVRSQASDRSNLRRDRLRDKIVAQTIRQARQLNPGLVVEAKALSILRQEVDDLLSKGQILDADLKRLVKRFMKNSGATTNSALNSTAPASSSYPFDADSTFQRESLPPTNVSTKRPLSLPEDVHEAAKLVRNLPPLQQKRIAIQKTQEPWVEIISRDLEQHKQEQTDRRLRSVSQKQEQRAFLDQQVQRRELQTVEEKRLTLAIAEEEMRQMERWKEEEVNSARRRKEETAALYKDLMQQREQALLKKQSEAEARKREEEEKVEKLHEEMRQEEQDRKRKKERVQAEIQQYLSFNQQMKAQRDMEKQKAAEADVRALREYDEKLLKEEQDRKLALKKISERQARQYELADVYFKSWQAQAERDEAKAKHEQASMEQKQREEEAKRRQKIKEDNKRIREIVAHQLSEKELTKKKAQEEAARQREEMARAVKVAEEKEMERKKEARLFALEGLKEIDRQLVEQHERRFSPPKIKIGERER